MSDDSNVTDISSAIKPWYCVTPTVRRIHGIFDLCSEGAEIGIVVGDSGTGKSTAAHAYASQYEERVHIFTVTSDSSTALGLLRGLCTTIAVFVPTRRDSGPELRARLLNSIHAAADALVIIDEAQKLDRAALELLRELYDEAQFGLVLISNPLFYAQLKGSDKKRGKLYFPQLAARITSDFTIPSALDADLDALCAHHRIASKDARAIIARAAAQTGQLHRVEKLLRRAQKIAGEDHVLAAHHLAQAAHTLGV